MTVTKYASSATYNQGDNDNPRSITFSIDIPPNGPSSVGRIDVDFSAWVGPKKDLDMVQGIIIDHTGGGPIQVSTVAGTTLTVERNDKLMSPVLVTLSNVISFIGNNVTINVTLTNFPLPYGVYNSFLPSTFLNPASDNAVPVVLKNPSVLLTQEYGFRDDDISTPARFGNVTSGFVNNPAFGTINLIGGFGTGLNPFVTGFQLSISQLISTGAAGYLLVSLEFNAASSPTVIRRARIPVNISTGAVSYYPDIINLSGLNIIGSGGGTLDISIAGSALAGFTGTLDYTLFGGLTALA